MKTISDFALDFAAKAHATQHRQDGRPYIVHPTHVGELVRLCKPNSQETESLVAAAYLHDVLEDTPISYYQLVDAFGYLVASLVMELTSNPDMKKGIGDKAAYLGYKLKHMTSWALIIKLCDRLDNITDMRGFSAARRSRYLSETQYILDYLKANRTLTATHNIIIEAIEKALNAELKESTYEFFQKVISQRDSRTF